MRWIIALVAVAAAAGLRFAADPWLASAQSYLMVVDAVLFALIVGMGVAMHAARRRAETSEEKFRRFMENAPAAVFIKDEAGRYVYMNAAAQGIVGVPDWQGKTDDELLPEEAAREVRAHDARMLETQAPGEFDLKIGERQFHSTKFPLRDAGGRLLIGAVSMDVTEQARAAEELRRQREELRIVTDTMSAGVVRISADLRYVWVNRVFASWVGKPLEEVIGRPIAEVIDERDWRDLHPHVERALRGERVEYERRAHFAAGERWIHSVMEPTRDERGAPNGLVAVVSDIQSRKEAEAALTSAREELQLVADGMPAAVALCSRDLRYVWVNRRYAEWIGTDAARARRPPDRRGDRRGGARRHPPVHRARARRRAGGVRAPDAPRRAGRALGAQPLRADARRHGLDRGRRRHPRPQADGGDAAPGRAAQGRVPRHARPRAAQSAGADPQRRGDPRQEGRARPRARVEPGSDRAPGRPDVAPDRRPARHRAHRARQARSSARSACRSSARSTWRSRPAARYINAAGHSLSVLLPSERVTVEADPARLAQVFSNLLNNAASYTERHGRSRSRRKWTGARSWFRVQDNGIGFRPEVAERLFEPFSQLTRSNERSHGGLGIGLTLVQGIVALHGGSVEARSRGPGQGSRIRRAPAAAEIHRSASGKRSPRRRRSRRRPSPA